MPRSSQPLGPAEREAKARSDFIDQQLASDGAFHARKRNKEILLLLLGQSESGKSTLQKQFQLLYAPHSLDSERSSWRAVIYSNIIRTLRQIIAVLDTTDLSRYASSSLARSASQSPISEAESDDSYQPKPRSYAKNLSAELTTLKMRLSPLLSMERSLADRLGGDFYRDPTRLERTESDTEIYVHHGWQALEPPPIGARRSSSIRRWRSDSTTALSPTESRDSLERDAINFETAKLFEACRKDVKTLWEHPIVRKLIKRGRIILKESSIEFLRDFDRIIAPSWTPTNQDILHARIRTIGVNEHEFEVRTPSKLQHFRLIDVGGAVTQRHIWAQFFEHATVIIFLAPVSAFDQYLDGDGEDKTLNRLHDSIELFQKVCTNELVKKAHLVLFLNKMDLLREKLDRGIMVNKYILSYNDRPNEVGPVVSYFKKHFVQIFDGAKRADRSLYVHQTTVVDTASTQKLIETVLDFIVKDHFKSSNIL